MTLRATSYAQLETAKYTRAWRIVAEFSVCNDEVPVQDHKDRSVKTLDSLTESRQCPTGST